MHDDHPLIAAAGAGDLARVAELLTAHPELVDVRGSMGCTPLIAATRQADSVEVVRFLLAHGADPLAARVNGDQALHSAASGPVAAALAAAAGPAGLAARYLFDRTPLHIAAEEDRQDVVRVLLAAGADATAVDHGGNTPLALTGDPRVALLLADTPPPTGTALPDACRRSGRDPAWLLVAERLLDRGVDPGRRDEFGALPSELTSELRDRLPTRELLPAEVAECAQSQVAIHPTGTEAVTSLFSGAVLARWRLTPTVEPVEVVRLGRRRRSWGPFDGLAFADRDEVWLRDWTALTVTRPVPAEVVPDNLYPEPALSVDGRYLVLPSCESVRLVDLDRGALVGELTDFGDWSVVPRFAPDGRTLAVGNSMQGTCWLTVLDVAEDGLRKRYELSDVLPSGGPEVVSDVAFTPDGTAFATWVRPDYGRPGSRGLVATTRTDSGEPAWHRAVTDDLVGTPGQPTSAALCFTPDGTHLAVGLDTGVLWLDAATGTPTAHDTTTGRVNGLAAHPSVGILAATEHGLRRIAPSH